MHVSGFCGFLIDGVAIKITQQWDIPMFLGDDFQRVKLDE